MSARIKTKKTDIFKFISSFDADRNVIVNIIENNGILGSTSEHDLMFGEVEKAGEVLEDIAKILGVGVVVGKRRYADGKD